VGPRRDRRGFSPLRRDEPPPATCSAKTAGSSGRRAGEGTGGGGQIGVGEWLAVSRRGRTRQQKDIRKRAGPRGARNPTPLPEGSAPKTTPRGIGSSHQVRYDCLAKAEESRPPLSGRKESNGIQITEKEGTAPPRGAT